MLPRCSPEIHSDATNGRHHLTGTRAVANYLVEIERGSGSLVTLRFGSRTKSIVNSHRRSLGKRKPDSGWDSVRC